MSNENKIKIIEAAEERFKNSSAIYFTNYTGMNVIQATELRKQFREKDVKFTVVKNTLNKIAAKNAFENAKKDRNWRKSAQFELDLINKGF